MKRLIDLLKFTKLFKDVRDTYVNMRTTPIPPEVSKLIAQHIESLEVKNVLYSYRSIQYMNAVLNAKCRHILIRENKQNQMSHIS